MLIGICKYCNKEFRKREQKYKFCSLICSSNYNRNGLKKIKLPRKSKMLAEFVGICLGDGNVSKYQIGITLNTVADKNYIPYVIKLYNSLFPELKVNLVKKKGENAVEVRINSKIVSDFLLNMGIVPNNKKVPNWIHDSSNYKKFCVRGLFDTEGSVSTKNYLSKKGGKTYYQLNFRNYNKRLMKFVRDTLLELKLKPTLSLKNSLYISNSHDLMIFNKEIGFSNPKLLAKLG